MSSAWYSVVSEHSLLQGDLLLGFQISEFDRAASEVALSPADVVVLTQSCDLANGKIENILVAFVQPYAELSRETHALRSSDIRAQLAQGLHPSLFLVPPHDPSPRLGWSIVDFHQLLTIPRSELDSYVAQSGDRLRLETPYREYMAQAFARHMMRIGLPVDEMREFHKFKPWN